MCSGANSQSQCLEKGRQLSEAIRYNTLPGPTSDNTGSSNLAKCQTQGKSTSLQGQWKPLCPIPQFLLSHTTRHSRCSLSLALSHSIPIPPVPPEHLFSSQSKTFPFKRPSSRTGRFCYMELGFQEDKKW